jgi:type I restriction enzyme M protein
VYDPTCGSGSLLLQVAKEIKRKGGDVSSYFGQEKNPSTYNLARMNMILHGVHYRSFDIQQDDTLETPHHFEKRFEAVVANPPFSAGWSANDSFLSDERFANYGKLAPKGKADFAFVQHMLHQLDDNGTMAVVLPHGVLFRPGSEAHIRKFLIHENNYLDCVVGLPANIFYGAELPTVILVLNKHRKFPEDILFIDASSNFERGTGQNNITDEHVNLIVETIERRVNVKKFAYVAPISEVEKNNFNINIPRYVDTFVPEDPIDLENIAVQIKNIEGNLIKVEKDLKLFYQELNFEGLTK